MPERAYIKAVRRIRAAAYYCCEKAGAQYRSAQAKWLEIPAPERRALMLWIFGAAFTVLNYQISYEALRRSERAWMLLGEPRFGYKAWEKDGYRPIEVPLKNFGNGPAFNVRIVFLETPIEPEDPWPPNGCAKRSQISIQEQIRTDMVGPGQEARRTVDAQLLGNEARMIHGLVVYDDQFGRPHATNFCQMVWIRPEDNVIDFDPCHRCNTAD